MNARTKKKCRKNYVARIDLWLLRDAILWPPNLLQRDDFQRAAMKGLCLASTDRCHKGSLVTSSCVARYLCRVANARSQEWATDSNRGVGDALLDCEGKEEKNRIGAKTH